ncbi:hypothetical protein [Microbacterium sp. K41]|uniref:hypothetical protein n=1 Tax=Microbacterium sp. K41 TaxID=2305437 RepID=UPI00109D0314|nr:hypothetical protein [Microbacterium sp. K41]
MKTYAVTAERNGNFWFIRIPELDGVTQARTGEEIPVMARDYIAVTLDVPVDSFDLTVTLLAQDGDRN